MKVIALALALTLSGFAAGPETEKGRSVGNPSAPLLFELYSDFMCPHCKILHEQILPAIILDYVKSGKAYLIYREYPLAIPAHVYSREAAAFAVAAAAFKAAALPPHSTARRRSASLERCLNKPGRRRATSTDRILLIV